MASDSRAPETRGHERIRAVVPTVILVYLIAWAFTCAHFMADTNVYTQAILDHEYRRASIDFRVSTSNPFWDFGHILWRPLGWLCWLLCKPMTRVLTHNNNERAEVLWTLFGLNFAAALLCVILFLKLARRITGSSWPAVLVTITFFSADAFLNYAHSGSPYVLGLACLVAGMWLSFGEGCHGNSVILAAAAGCMFALAVLFWLPYVFVLPAAIAAPLWINRNDRRWAFAGHTIVACTVIGVAAYGSIIAILGIRDSATLKDWILSSGHGQIQAGGFRVLARLAFSVPRSFIHMDRDGMWLKRYLVHDPYAPTAFRDLLRLSLWKLLLFYGAAGIVGIELLRSKQGRVWTLVTGCAVVPILVFAAFIFEAGSIERYLPIYPFVFLACLSMLTASGVRRFSKLLLMFAMAATVAVNINGTRRGALESARSAALSRIDDLLPLLGPESLVIAVNEQDNLAEFRQNFPLDAINLQSRWQSYDMLEINAERLRTWREDFSKQVLTTWQGGGNVWIPKRVFRSKPRPEWNWVEGDDKRVKWPDLPLFFSRFEMGRAVGGEDGFVFLLPSAHNASILIAMAQK
jgi:hypothetical protein